jgi:hypothetical protein
MGMIDEKRLDAFEKADERCYCSMGDGEICPGHSEIEDALPELLRLARLGLMFEKDCTTPPPHHILKLNGMPIDRLYALAEWAEKHGVPALRICNEHFEGPHAYAPGEALAALPKEKA